MPCPMGKTTSLAFALLIVASCNRTTDLVAPQDGPNGGGSATCTPGGTECNNCKDDDGDGLVDGFDPHCTSSIDNREDSFATGIPGDNNNLDFQDCYFDGNSGHGDDGCRLPTCCLTDPLSTDCPPPGTPPFITCDPTEVCTENCAPLVPPGCDCFGCCTICNGQNCWDVLINPLLAPECDLDVLSDNNKCPACTKSACGSGCNLANCILCPGQTEQDLPSHCSSSACPGNEQPCRKNSDCRAGEFCAVGCCVADAL